MTRCLLGIGSNLGDPARQLAEAFAALADAEGVQLLKRSHAVSSLPIGGPAGQPPFLNAAALIETRLSPSELLVTTQQIEQRMGRVNTIPWAARPLDIDLLLYGDAIVRDDRLCIPHPWMATRRFVLEPAAEIAPEMLHPLLGWTVEQLKQHLVCVAPRFALVGHFDLQTLESIAGGVGAVLVTDPLRPTAGGRDPGAARGERAVPSLDQQVESTAQRAASLRQSPWTQEPPRGPVLSDFWIEQSWVDAHASLTAEDWPRFVAEFRRLTGDLAPPKLIVLAAQRAKDLAERSDFGLPEDEIARLRQRALKLGQSPLVDKVFGSRDDLVRQVTGALLAMR